MQLDENKLENIFGQDQQQNNKSQLDQQKLESIFAPKDQDNEQQGNFAVNLGKSSLSTVARMSGGLFEYMGEIGESTRESMPIEGEEEMFNPDQALKQGSEKLHQISQKLAPKVESKKDIFGNFSSGNYKQAGKQLAYGIAANLPQYGFIAASTLTGNPNAGLQIITAATAGSEYEGLEGQDMSEGMKKINATMKAASEFLFERFGTIPVVQKAFSNNAVRNQVQQGLKEGIAEFLKSSGREGATEAATEVAQNATDVLTNNRDENGNLPSLFEGAADAGIIGGIMGGGMELAGNVVSDNRVEQESIDQDPVEAAKDLTSEVITEAATEDPDMPTDQTQITQNQPQQEQVTTDVDNIDQGLREIFEPDKQQSRQINTGEEVVPQKQRRSELEDKLEEIFGPKEQQEQSTQNEEGQIDYTQMINQPQNNSNLSKQERMGQIQQEFRNYIAETREIEPDHPVFNHELNQKAIRAASKLANAKKVERGIEYLEYNFRDNKNLMNKLEKEQNQPNQEQNDPYADMSEEKLNEILEKQEQRVQELSDRLKQAHDNNASMNRRSSLRAELANASEARNFTREKLANIDSQETNQQTPQEEIELLDQGEETAVVTPSNEEVGVRYAIAEADDLISSETKDFQTDERFPQELQPRDRQRGASKSQVEDIMNNLDPELLGENRMAAHGAPTIGPDGVVEVGNARTISLKRLYAEDHANKETYQEWLRDNAERFGIDPETVEQAEQPVLVKKRESDVNREQFVIDANKRQSASMSATEQAQVDAKQINSDILAHYNPEYDIATRKNRDFVDNFLDQVVGEAEKGKYYDSNNNLSKDGRKRIENAIFARTYGDSHAIERLTESDNSNVNNVVNAMLEAAPKQIKIQEEIRKGNLYDKDIATEIADTVAIYEELKRQGEPIEDFVNQERMFDNQLTPLKEELLKMFENNKYSRKKIREILTAYQEGIEAVGNPKQESMFDNVEPPTEMELLEAAINTVTGESENSGPRLFKEQEMDSQDDGAKTQTETEEEAIDFDLEEQDYSPQELRNKLETKQKQLNKLKSKDNLSSGEKSQLKYLDKQVYKLKKAVSNYNQSEETEEVVQENKPNEEVDQEKQDTINQIENENENLYAIHPSLRPNIENIDTEALYQEVQAQEKFDTAKDNWFGNKDWAEVVNSVEAKKFEDQIKASAEKHDLDPQELNLALQLHIDLKPTKNMPDKPDVMIEKYYDELTPEQQEMVDLSQNLTEEQQQIAENIIAADKEMGLAAKSEGVIKNVIENHLMRKWESDQPYQSREGMGKKFSRKTSLAKQRTLESILEGWAEGKELKIEGATKNLQTSKDELVRTIEDKRLMDTLLAEDIFIPEHKLNPEQLDDYSKIEHPNFTKWERTASVDLEAKPLIHGEFYVGDKVRVKESGKIGKISMDRDTGNVLVTFKDAEVKQDGDKHYTQYTEIYSLNELEKVRPRGANVFIGDDGQVYEKVEMYAPNHVAEELNNILGSSSLMSENHKWIRGLTQINSSLKELVLQSSFFHHFAFARSYGLATNVGLFEALTTKNPKQAYQEGLEMIEQLDDELELLVRNGLTLGRMQDWEVSNYRKRSDNKLMNLLFGKEGGLREEHAKKLFKKIGAGLKAKAALMEYRYMLKENPEMAKTEKGRNQLAKNVANLINQDFGGLHLERMGRNPTTQHIFRLLSLAPDWTESNFKMMYHALPRTIKDGLKKFTEGFHAKRESLLNDGDYQKEIIPSEIKQQLERKLANEGHDLSQKEKSQIKYMIRYFDEQVQDENRQAKLARHAILNVVKKGAALTLLMNLALAALDDKTFLQRYKLAFKGGYGGWTDFNWLAVDITPLYHLFGVSSGGERKYASIFGHFEDPLELIVNPIQFSKYKGSMIAGSSLDLLTGTNWQGKRYTNFGELTGMAEDGDYQGQTTRWEFGGGGAVEYSQIPSFMLSQAYENQPIQVQNAISLMQGNMNTLDAILDSIGVHVRSADPKSKEGSSGSSYQLRID